MFELHPQLNADTIDLGSLSLCRVLLMNDLQFPWLILVPQIENASEIYDLDKAQQAQLFSEISTVGENMMQAFHGDKLNTAALGNMVPQLHIHLIVRFKTDVAWPKPVWGQQAPIPYSEEQLSDMKNQLATLIATNHKDFSPC